MGRDSRCDRRPGTMFLLLFIIVLKTVLVFKTVLLFFTMVLGGLGVYEIEAERGRFVFLLSEGKRLL